MCFQQIGRLRIWCSNSITGVYPKKRPLDSRSDSSEYKIMNGSPTTKHLFIHIYAASPLQNNDVAANCSTDQPFVLPLIRYFQVYKRDRGYDTSPPCWFPVSRLVSKSGNGDPEPRASWRQKDGNSYKSYPPVARGILRCNMAGWQITQRNAGFNMFQWETSINGGFCIAMFDHQRAAFTISKVVSIS